ncbi:MAG: DUF5009 domain-containing protein [Bacteroidetes bacterium]|nr:DUF5009 domain-containing protein [Bacteroidota bacterium]MDA1122207.1 DUF5009 domain-containing protein [Bacteroidota bacterium]
MKSTRFASIDIMRAVTMLLMIFVNDLWSLTDIPGWLGHAKGSEDRLGFSDIIFPAFLFIVGLSIPYAIKARISKGESNLEILKHIALRSVALIVMGFFHVNLENINASELSIAKPYWQILMTLSFFLIWNNYTDKKAFNGKVPEWVMQVAGIAILILLFFTYKDSTDNDLMKFRWYGILGLIGWSYLFCATLYLLLRDNLIWIGIACFAFYLLNVNQFIQPFDISIPLVVSASNPASVMTGVLVTVILINLKAKERIGQIIPVLLGLGTILMIFGILTRPEWGISKIGATPSWTAICAGISITTFVVLHIVADKMGHVKWASIISPAGYSTLTCYLVPYFAYAIVYNIMHLNLPDVMTTGVIGLIKSMLFSMIIIWITGLLFKFKISLKI